MTYTVTTDASLETRDDKLARLFGELAGAMLQRGLDYARRDDPHAFARVAKFRQDAGARFELRIGFDDPAGTLVTRGLLCDADGEALAEVFTISASAAPRQRA